MVTRRLATLSIVASPHEEEFHIVSGHRRHMAQLLAFALHDWVREDPETEVTIEVVRAMINSLAESSGAESAGTPAAVVASLLTQYGEREVEFVTFAGSRKAEILALHAANYGSEQPDMLGVAHSFRQAVAVGATPEEIARNSGQHVNFVRNHLALTDVPPQMPRDWLREQILQLVQEAIRRHSNRNAFEFLTGRPMSANENYGDWFRRQLEDQGGELSDAQLFTLFVWAHAEWQRAQRRPFSLPVNAHAVQFVTVRERPFSIDR